jgi:hypothetical protein
VVGSPTHPVMPNLVMLWKISPLRGGVRAGTRLWAREATRRARGAIGSELKPGVAGGEPGPLRGQARWLGYLLSGNYGPAHPISQARKCKLSSVLLSIVANWDWLAAGVIQN